MMRQRLWAVLAAVLMCAGISHAQQDVRGRIEGVCASNPTEPVTAPADAESLDAEIIVQQIAAGQPIDLFGVAITGNLDMGLLLSNAGTVPVDVRQPITIADATLDGNLIIPDDVRFLAPFTFNGTTITGSVSIAQATFTEAVDFSSVTLGGAITVNETVFNAPVTFVGARAQSLVNFIGVTFSDSVAFSDARFGSQVSFLAGTTFEHDLAFERARFGTERLRFNSVAFADAVTFVDAQLCGSTRFDDVSASSLDFTGAVFGSDLRFQDGSQFAGDVLLTDVDIAGDLRVRSGATFGGDVVLSGVRFASGSKLSIRDGNFEGDLDGVGADFTSTDGFEVIDSTFDGDADFTDAQFSITQPFELTESVFNRDLSLNRAGFNNTVTITRTDANGTTDMRGAAFAGDVRITESTFNDELLFRGAAFASQQVIFTDSDFTSIDLSSVSLQDGSLDMVGATYDELVAFDLNLDVLAVPQDALERFEVYSALERSFRAQGSQELINEAHYEARAAECVLSARTPDISYLVNCPMSQYFLGYRVRLLPPIRTAVITVVLFGFLYWLGGLKAIPDPDDPAPRSGETIWDALGLSFDLFFAIRFNQIHVDFDNMRVAWLWRGLVLTEWVFGLYILVGLASALANTVPLFSTVLEQLR
ncbi:MAG: hypothetical protein AAF653_00030 [Chloroflexota bacterium]